MVGYRIHAIPSRNQSPTNFIKGAPMTSLSHLAVVLIGGKAKRLGGIDKAALPHKTGNQDKTFLSHLCNTLDSVSVPWVLSGRPSQHSQYSNSPFCEDLYPDTGPLGGLVSAMETFPADWYLLVACDLPLFSPAIPKKLFELQSVHPEAKVVIPRQAPHLQSTGALYHNSLLPQLKERLKEGKCSFHKFIRALPVDQVQYWDLTFQQATEFLNINHPDDLQKLAKIQGETP